MGGEDEKTKRFGVKNSRQTLILFVGNVEWKAK